MTEWSVSGGWKVLCPLVQPLPWESLEQRPQTGQERQTSQLCPGHWDKCAFLTNMLLLSQLSLPLSEWVRCPSRFRLKEAACPDLPQAPWYIKTNALRRNSPWSSSAHRGPHQGTETGPRPSCPSAWACVLGVAGEQLRARLKGLDPGTYSACLFKHKI